MSDIKLFRIDKGSASEIHGYASHLERSIQELIETNLEPLLGIRFLASEYSTGKTHGGRIDTLGLDENACPVIIEYKRTTSENVINQGLFYLDWLMDHQAEFVLLVIDQFGKEVADSIDWSAPRLLCIAADFTRYDEHAVQQINRNIELLRYRKFGEELFLLELVNAVTAKGSTATETKSTAGKGNRDKTVNDWLKDLPKPLKGLFDELESFLLSLGDDVQRKDLKHYIAFKRLRNFATVLFRTKRLIVQFTVDDMVWNKDFVRDISKIGHHGTGNYEISIATPNDLEKAKPILEAAYGGR